MTWALSPLLMRHGGIVLVALGIGIIAYDTLSGDTILTRYYRQYIASLNRHLRLLFLSGSGERIAAIQLVLAAVMTGLGMWLAIPYWYAGVALVALGPSIHLQRKRKEHISKLEAQVDGFILGLANALKTVPSPSAAVASLAPILPAPMQQEIDRLLKEMRVGSSLEQALLNMTGRLRSTELDAALSSLLIGLQVGGNLPHVLETTAATIREMNRLQGVVKTKTAEARAQLWVLAVFPFVISYIFVLVDPEYFTPLQTTFVGSLITGVALILWLAALLVARRVLKVDL